MGQYYYPLNVKKNQRLIAHDYDNGLKIMEHSWVGNNFVNVVISLLAKGGIWHGCKIIWVGDYSESYSELIEKAKVIKPKEVDVPSFKYLINRTKKEFVKIPENDVNIWQIHPLPLLTCDGEGFTLGGYHGSDNDNIIGTWKLCNIEPTNEVPKNYKEIIFNLKYD